MQYWFLALSSKAEKTTSPQPSPSGEDKWKCDYCMAGLLTYSIFERLPDFVDNGVQTTDDRKKLLSVVSRLLSFKTVAKVLFKTVSLLINH